MIIRVDDNTDILSTLKEYCVEYISNTGRYYNTLIVHEVIAKAIYRSFNPKERVYCPVIKTPSVGQINLNCGTSLRVKSRLDDDIFEVQLLELGE